MEKHGLDFFKLVYLGQHVGHGQLVDMLFWLKDIYLGLTLTRIAGI